jgi:hypothetical protein
MSFLLRFTSASEKQGHGKSKREEDNTAAHSKGAVDRYRAKIFVDIDTRIDR